MEAQKFIQELIHGKQELASQLAHVEAQIRELKARRKALRLQIANSDGAIAGAEEFKKRQAKADEAAEEAEVDDS